MALAFSEFAKVYDQIMDDSLYDAWLAFSQRHFSSDTHTVLELACGTGKLSGLMHEAGYDVVGVDLSEEMLVEARKNVPDVTFWRGDMTSLEGVGTYDAVTCYSDSICYLPDDTSVLATFYGVYDALASGGTFIFDCHSIHQMEDVFPGYAYHENEEDYAFLWDSYEGDWPHSIEHQLSFFVKQADGRFERQDELHEERTYPIDLYLELLAEAGFKEVQVYADFEDVAPVADSARWFFVCQKD
jgi:SAM-dependent methyltransferase